jgi:hypothetical protein
VELQTALGEIAYRLGVSEGTPVVSRHERRFTAFDQYGKPMRVTVTIFPVDRQQFIIGVGEVPAPQFKPAKQPRRNSPH